MKRFFEKIAAFLRRYNIIYHRRYDTQGSVYTAGNEAEPKFSYTFKGNYTISIGRILGFFAAVVTFVLTLGALVSFLVTSLFSLTAFTGLGKLNRFRRKLKRRRKKKLKLKKAN